MGTPVTVLRVVVAVTYELEGGGTANRVWEVSAETAEALVDPLGPPFMCNVLNADELADASRIFDRSETPPVWDLP